MLIARKNIDSSLKRLTATLIEVPAGYEFGINPNDPVAVGLGIPRGLAVNGSHFFKVPN